MRCAFPLFSFNHSGYLSIFGTPRKPYQIVGKYRLGIGAPSDMALNCVMLPGGNAVEVITI